MKRCPKCKTEKADEEFHKDSRRVDGLDYRCKLCKAAQACSISQKRRDAIRYAKDSSKAKARDAARRQWGPASTMCCRVLGCFNMAVELHHVDYAEPLAVIPLCNKHHRGIHS